MTYRTGGELLLATKNGVKMPGLLWFSHVHSQAKINTDIKNCVLKNYKLGYCFDHLDGFDILRT